MASALLSIGSDTRPPIPRKPVLGRESISLSGANRDAFFGTRYGKAVTSGRAAIFWALKLLGVCADDFVLVPTYHCPTLVAPVVALGALPSFYPLTRAGLPDVARIDIHAPGCVRAMIAPQLFGFPGDLSDVRHWCDKHGVSLIEDCAHSPFGRAGDRAVGHWGDFATASLSKLLPVVELGWLASATRELPVLDLQPCPIREQLKAIVTPLEVASLCGRLGLTGSLLRAVFRRRQPLPGETEALDALGPPTPADIRRALVSCDLDRIGVAPAAASRLIASLADYRAIGSIRRRNYRSMAALLMKRPLGRLLREAPDEDTAPYALPLVVDNPDRLYPAMRSMGFPVYRWDQQWPGTPAIAGDATLVWRRRLFQIPIHQSYLDEEFDRIGEMLNRLSRIARESS